MTAQRPARKQASGGRRRAPTTPAEAMMERGYGGLQQQVERLVKDLQERTHGQFRGYHTHRSEHSPAGFPDWIFAGPGGIIVAELKRARENPTDDQQWWLNMFALFGIPVYVWRPSDLLSGAIAYELTALAALPVHVPSYDVTLLAGILRTAVSDSITAGLAENLARAAIRSGHTHNTHNPQPPGSAHE